MGFLCVMLLVFAGFMETISENFKVVGPAAPLIVKTGEDLVLPCSLQPNISVEDMMVEWIRTDLPKTQRLVHLYEGHEDRNVEQSKSYRGRTALFKEELQQGNTSLKLSAVQPSDEGVYQCAVKSESWYEDAIVRVEVRIHLKVVGPAAPLVVKAGEDLVLPCSIKPSISAENMKVEWIRQHLTERLVHLYEQNEDRNEKQMESYRGRTSLFREEPKHGNTSLKLSAVRPSDEGAYQCYVEYPGFLYDDAVIYVAVKGTGFHAWKTAIVCISVFAVLLVAFTACILREKYTKKKLSPEQCSVITYMHLQSENVKKEFDLKKYDTSEDGYRRLIPAITNSRKAQFTDCNLSVQSLRTLVTALQSKKSSLKEMDLSHNKLKGSVGVELLSAVQSSHCKLETLKLDLCDLGVKACERLGSVLRLDNSSLKELDLSNNDLQDSGVELLCAGLKSSHCKLQTLRLSGCMITEKGCSSLDSALHSNPSHLKELDLTYNHPGESGVKLLSARLEDPHCSLSTLGMEHGGMIRMKPGLRKYACELTLDPNTAHTDLVLCEENRKVEWAREEQPYPDHLDRFDEWKQVLCRESVSGRCYWEAEWSVGISIALAYKSIRRKGWSDDCVFGGNEQSWSLECFNNSYSVLHNDKSTAVPPPPPSCNRVGVYVDCAAGTVSFYSVSSDTHTLTHLHTFSSTFTEPLYAGFGVYYDSSVRVCVTD